MTAGTTPFRFGQDADGNYGYIIAGEDGADTVIPFESLDTLSAVLAAQSASYTATEDGIYIMVIDTYAYYGNTYGNITAWNHSCSGKLLLKAHQTTSSGGHDCPMGLIVCKLSKGQSMSMSITSTGGSYAYVVKRAIVIKLT